MAQMIWFLLYKWDTWTSSQLLLPDPAQATVCIRDMNQYMGVLTLSCARSLSLSLCVSFFTHSPSLSNKSFFFFQKKQCNILLHSFEASDILYEFRCVLVILQRSHLRFFHWSIMYLRLKLKTILEQRSSVSWLPAVPIFGCGSSFMNVEFSVFELADNLIHCKWKDLWVLINPGYIQYIHILTEV